MAFESGHFDLAYRGIGLRKDLVLVLDEPSLQELTADGPNLIVAFLSIFTLFNVGDVKLA
jgi:hypothetical protein